MQKAEAAWPSSQRVGLAIRRSRVRVPLLSLAGYVLGRPEFKSSTTLVKSLLVASCQLGFLILLCSISYSIPIIPIMFYFLFYFYYTRIIGVECL